MTERTESAQKLQRLSGAWVGEETMHPTAFDPEGGTATGRAVNRPGLLGNCIIQDYTQYRRGGASFEGHAVFWYDPAASEYVMHWFGSMQPGVTEYRGTFEGDVLTLIARAPQGFSRTTFIFGAPHRYRFELAVSPDGSTWTTFLEADYERVTG